MKNLPSTLTVTIERILPGGLGLAHAAGRTIFVGLAAPGDVARVRIDRVQGKVAFASMVEIVTPGPSRVAPPCRYFGECGGCDCQQLTYEAQLAAKVEIVKDCLRRIAKIEPPEVSITPAPRQWGYRTRAEWQREGRRLGYFARRSHRVCDVSECAVLAPELQTALAGLRRQDLPAGVTEINAQTGDDGTSLAPLSVKDVNIRVGAHTYRLNANSFFQSSPDLLEPLIEFALTGAAGETALDLYCGVGLFTLPLAERFARVVGVENNLAAVEYAQTNLIGAGFLHADAVYSTVGEWLAENLNEWRGADFALLDPPRAGVEPGAVETLLKLAPKRISYVSCDPATLARDLRGLLNGGYALTAIQAFDLFPQTHHVETVARFERADCRKPATVI
jgi:23S rRNA (uracil1939-C5)-methyltransferase